MGAMIETFVQTFSRKVPLSASSSRSARKICVRPSIAWSANPETRGA